MSRYFLTVEWCNNDQRGVFARSDGNTPWKDGEGHTYEEIQKILGPFSIILSPESIEMTEDDLAEYTYYRPLAEYQGEYGIALKEVDMPYPIVDDAGGWPEPPEIW